MNVFEDRFVKIENIGVATGGGPPIWTGIGREIRANTVELLFVCVGGISSL